MSRKVIPEPPQQVKWLLCFQAPNPFLGFPWGSLWEFLAENNIKVIITMIMIILFHPPHPLWWRSRSLRPPPTTPNEDPEAQASQNSWPHHLSLMFSLCFVPSCVRVNKSVTWSWQWPPSLWPSPPHSELNNFIVWAESNATCFLYWSVLFAFTSFQYTNELVILYPRILNYNWLCPSVCVSVCVSHNHFSCMFYPLKSVCELDDLPSKKCLRVGCFTF